MATPKNLKIATLTDVGIALFMTPVGQGSKFAPDKIEGSIILTPKSKEKLQVMMEKLVTDNAKELKYDATKALYPFKEDLDRDKNPTGNFRLKCKTGIEYPPTYADAKGRNFKPEQGFVVPNGSKVRFAVTIVASSTAIYKGISCRLNGIQILSTPSTNVEFGAMDEGDYTYEAESVADVDDSWAVND